MSEQKPFALPVKVIAVDLDGTLLNSEHQLSARTERAVRAAHDEGLTIVLATGKTRASATGLIDQLGLDAAGIFVGGALTYNSDGSIRDQQTLNIDVARQVITFAEDRGYDVLLYSGDRLLMRRESPLAGIIEGYGEPTVEFVGPLQNLLDEMPLNKLILYHQSAQRIKSVRWQLSMQVDGQVKMMHASMENQLEILPPHASKGIALRKLLKSMGIKTDQVMAIGDAENDIDMLASVAVSVAVGNAGDKVKETARHVVGTNDEDGVAQAIEKYVLGDVLEAEDVPAAESVVVDDEAGDEAVPRPEDSIPGGE